MNNGKITQNHAISPKAVVCFHLAIKLGVRKRNYIQRHDDLCSYQDVCRHEP